MTILLLETLHAEAEALLRARGEVLLAPGPAAFAADTPWDRIEAIVTRGRGRIDADLLSRCSRLRVVGRAGVGLDNVDLGAARRANVPVVYAPGANSSTVAEHTVALMLMLVRRLGAMTGAVSGGHWDRRSEYDGDELAGKTLGIVGYGAIGKRVGALGAALGMEVVAAERPGLACEHRTLPLPALLASADVISLHLPLTAETRTLIDAAALASFKPGAFLVNTARGALVDQGAVAVALASGRLGGFAADVLDVEPPPPDLPLLGAPRALITPHVASLTARTYRAMCVRTARNILAVLGGQPPDHEAPR